MKSEEVCEVSEENKHQEDIESIVVAGDKVYSGADDGIIKIWSSKDLKLIHEFKAHDYAITSLLVMGDRLFSASMDQTIKSWQVDTWKLVATFAGHEDSPRRLATDGEFVFCGDDKGHVIKWTKDGDPSAKYEMVEEVWDLHIQNPYIYTIRDRGLTISETKPDSASPTVVRSLEGRAPFYISGNYLIMVDRSGTVINHFQNKPPTYEFVRELKGHEKIITAMTGWKDYLLSAGYDEELVLWNLTTGKNTTKWKLKGCPSVIRVTDDGDVFIGGPNGIIVKYRVVV